MRGTTDEQEEPTQPQQAGKEWRIWVYGIRDIKQSGDILITDVDIKGIETGDILIIASTGAYGYSMSSNYNKIPKAAVVSVQNGKSRVICKRQTLEELLALEVL